MTDAVDTSTGPDRSGPADARVASAAAPAAVVLRAEGVGKTYGGHAALSRVDLSVRRGETIAITGPSGSGKTTFLRCVNFLVPYEEGRIFVNGVLIGYQESNGRLIRDSEANINRVRQRIGMVFQRFALFPHRTALGNLLEGPVYVLKVAREEAAARAREALRVVGLSGKEDSYPHQLSGGQQQRVAIARALCMRPDIMLFDEVTSALDPELVDEVLSVMRDLAAKHMTMLVVTHELQFARDAADRVVFMEGGRILNDCPSDEFFSAPTARIASFLRRHRND